jgi:hypothetical protein
VKTQAEKLAVAQIIYAIKSMRPDDLKFNMEAADNLITALQTLFDQRYVQTNVLDSEEVP